MVWEGKLITNTNFDDRKKYFEKAADICKNISSIDLQIKPFERLTNKFQNQIKEFKNNKKTYETDGFVLTPYKGNYFDMTVYKYKPLDSLTVDFLIKKCPKKLLGIKPYNTSKLNLYILFCTISGNAFNKLKMSLINYYNEIFPNINSRYLPNKLPIQFQTSDSQYSYLYYSDDTNLDGKIGEFRIKNYKSPHTEYEWEFIRIREDREVELKRGNYFGNSYKVAELIWMSYQNPLIIEDMDLNGSDVYFKRHESTLHEAQRSYNSYVKSRIFNQFRGTKTCMDLASGKGQDLFRYGTNNFEKLLFLEIDRTALIELVNRKHDYSYNRRGSNMEILLQQIDLNKPYRENIEKIELSNLIIPNNGFNVIMCNLAFHYFISTTSSVINIGKFINNYLKPGGRFVFTAFDGIKIVKLLEEHKGEWNSSIKGKYSIRKLYNDNVISNVGQKIELLLPFSGGNYYSEYIVNIEYISKEFKKLGMTLEVNDSYLNFINDYKVNKNNTNKIMDNDDMKFVDLYHYYCFYKKNNK